MAHHFDEFTAKPLGKGEITGNGSVVNATLSTLLSNYKKTVASNYRSILSEEANVSLPPGKLVVSPKIDGQLWYLMSDDGDPVLISPTGRVIAGDLPLLTEYKKIGNRGESDCEDPQVFISFASPDQEKASEVVKLLETQGIKPWFSPRDMASQGGQFEEQLLHNIQNTTGILILLSVHASKSIYVPVEVAKAVEARKKIFVLCVDESRPEGVLEFYLSHIQWADGAGEKFEGAVDRLAGEIKSALQPEQTIMAGELFVAQKQGRPRVGDLASMLGGGADANVDALGFCAFDLVSGGDSEAKMPLANYEDRLSVLQRLCQGGKRVRAITSETTTDKSRINELFSDWVDGGKAEGLVVRTPDNNIYKIKPVVTLDAAIIGYTDRQEDPEQVRSVLLALMRDDGHFQIIGSCGNLGDAASRKDLMARLKESHVNSNYRHVSKSGVLYQFVEPKVVFEVRINDAQTDLATGGPVEKMVLQHSDHGWAAVRKMPGVSLIHPVMSRLREDKQVNDVDVRMAQLNERCFIPDIHSQVELKSLPVSTVLRREVYGKLTKGELAVRKLLVWKTNKEEEEADYPAFVVHWTDYSAGRKDPLKREVRLAPDEATAQAIAEDMLVANIKKGWERKDDDSPKTIDATPETTKKDDEANPDTTQPAVEATKKKATKKKATEKKATKKKATEKKATKKKATKKKTTKKKD